MHLNRSTIMQRKRQQAASSGDNGRHQLGFGRVLQRTALPASVLCLMASLITSMALGQQGTFPADPPESTAPQSGQEQDRYSVRKVPMVPRSKLGSRVGDSANLAASDSIRGVTYVALDERLQQVFRGFEPRSLEELRALEDQQERVSKAIEEVTVNVQQGAAQGSGVIITPDGYVLTAAHVAGRRADADAWIILNDGTRVRAKTLGMNRNMDAGLLKIVDERDQPWPHATLGRSADLRIGQWCIAAGHPQGWQQERGAVIRVGRILSIEKDADKGEAHTIFTDCALIGGDSGGPLFTLEGKLVGVHSRIGADISDNMHVPIDVFAASWDRMVRKDVWGALPGYRPVIGVSGRPDDPRAIIGGLIKGGPAHKAGLQVGDVIIRIDGEKISSFAKLKRAIEATLPGDTIVATIRRDEQILKLPIIVGLAN